MSEIAKPFGQRSKSPPPSKAPFRALSSEETPLEPNPDATTQIRPELERRAHVRQRCLLVGRIVDPRSGAVHNCMFRDIAPVGARIKVEAGVSLPEEFYLIDLKKWRLMVVRLVWRNDDELGVNWLDKQINMLISNEPFVRDVAVRLGMKALRSA